MPPAVPNPPRGVFPPSPFPAHPPSPWAEDALHKAEPRPGCFTAGRFYTPTRADPARKQYVVHRRGSAQPHVVGCQIHPGETKWELALSAGKELAMPAEQSMKPPKGDQPHKACRQLPAPVNRG